MKKNSRNKKSDKKFSLKEQYIKSWKYLKESRNFIYFTIAMFFLFAVLGFVIKLPEEVSNVILDYLKGVLEETEGLSDFGLIRYIFLNNLQSSFMGFFFGFVLGIFPFLATVFNGYVIGFVSALAVEAGGWETLLLLVPHGIFELPAIFISLGLGIKFGSFIFHKKHEGSFRRFLWEGLRVFVFVVIPLLVIAAVIEGLLI